MNRARAWPQWVPPVVLAAAAAILFSVLLAGPQFADPDSFYHAKSALLLRDQGVVQTFPWLPFTELAQHYADQHFLYHLLLVPFVSFPDPLVGLKIATVVFGTAFLLTFFWVLRSLRVPNAFLGTVLMLVITPLTFRLALAKGNALALIILWLALWAVFSYRPRLLGVLAFLYVWAHNGFPLLLVAVGLFWVASALADRVERSRHLDSAVGRLFAWAAVRFRSSRPHATKLVLATVIGAIAGLVINPFFPENLPVFYNQFFEIGVRNYRSVIGVGGEWYAYPPLDLLTNTIVLTIPLLIALVIFAVTVARQSRRSLTLFVLTVAFFLITLKSRRYVEYYVPLGMFFILSAYGDALRGRAWETVASQQARRLVSRWRTFIPSVAFIVYAAILLPTVIVRDLVTEYRDLRQGFRQTQYQAALQWLQQNAAPGAIVAHSDWDEFPVLFYYNDQARYIAGLDPTFLYTADRARYQTWVELTTGVYRGSVVAGLRSLNASYAFVDAEHTAMARLLDSEPAIERVYADSEATVYRVPER